MSSLSFTVPSVPAGASWSVAYQERGINLGTGAWTPLLSGLTVDRVEAEVSYRRDVLFRAQLRDRDGFVVRTIYTLWAAETQDASEVPAPSAIDVAPQGTALGISAQAPSTPTRPAEQVYDVEVRAGAATPEDSVPYSHQGLLVDGPRTPYGCEVPIPICPGASTEYVHARLRRRVDGKAGPWLTVQPTLPPLDEYGELVDDDTAFSGGTIEQTAGFDHLEVSAGTLQLAAGILDDSTDANATDDGAFPLDDMGALFEAGYYQTADLVHDQVVDFELQLCAELGTLVRTAVLDSDEVEVPVPLAGEGEDPVDVAQLELPDDAATHEEPPRLGVEVSTTQDGSVWSGFETYVPGRVLVAKGYRARVHLAHRLPLQIPVPQLLIRRRRKNRKWEWRVPFDYPTVSGRIDYTFSPAPAVMDATSLVVEECTVHHLSSIDARYDVVSEALSATAIQARVVQVVEGDLTLDGSGNGTWTYPAAFFSAPIVTAGGGGPLNFSGAPSATQAAFSGGTANATVHLIARGIPPITDRELHVILTGV